MTVTFGSADELSPIDPVESGDEHEAFLADLYGSRRSAIS